MRKKVGGSLGVWVCARTRTIFERPGERLTVVTALERVRTLGSLPNRRRRNLETTRGTKNETQIATVRRTQAAECADPSAAALLVSDKVIEAELATPRRPFVSIGMVRECVANRVSIT